MIITRDQQEKLLSNYNAEKHPTTSEYCAFIDGMDAMFRMVHNQLLQELKERKELNI